MTLHKTFTLDIDLKRDTFIEQPTVTANDSNQFIINIFDDGEPFDLSNVTSVTIAHTRLDRKTIVNSGTKTGPNQVTFIVDRPETSFGGSVKSLVQLYNGDSRISTFTFTYRVNTDPTANYSTTNEEKTLIQVVLGEGPKVIQDAIDVTLNANEKIEILDNKLIEIESAENTRETNETNRQSTFESKISEVNEVITTATTSANKAEEKATFAEEQANRAKEEADRLSGTDVSVLDNKLTLQEQEITEVKSQLAQITNETRNMSIPVLESDPISPANGQIWLMKYYELLRETFTGVDGNPLNSSIWEIVKTKTSASTVAHAPTNRVDIRGNKAQFNVATSATVTDGGFIEVMARMKKFEIDWTNEKRTITWKQQPYIETNSWGMYLSGSLAVDGGNLIPSYAIRVIHSKYVTSLQMKNLAQSAIVYNQNFTHNGVVDTLSEFKLVIEPGGANITIYQDGVQKLTVANPDLGRTKAWLYFYTQTNSTTPIIRDIDDIVIE